MKDKTVFSKSHKEHLSKALKGKSKSQEHKDRISAGMKLRHQQKQDSNLNSN